MAVSRWCFKVLLPFEISSCRNVTITFFALLYNFNSFFYQILQTESGLPFRESALPCPKGSMLPPPAVMLSPQTQPYLVHNIREQILIATEEVLSPAMGNDTNVFRFVVTLILLLDISKIQ